MQPPTPGRDVPVDCSVALSRDRGSTSLTTVLLAPVFVVLAFAAFQAAMFTHARTEARAVARDAAVLVARHGESAAAVATSSSAALAGSELIRDVDVSVAVDDGLVVVRLTGRAPGIVRGTSWPIDVTEALPIEGFRS